jgi:SAM-dependent methyltransferase
VIGVRAARLMAKALGLHALAWKLRKLDFGIGANDLVLDAGGGAAPNPYANVVVDYDPTGRESQMGNVRSNGKSLIWADLQRLPFRDRVFDYALCFHVVEHVADPAAALGELQRVAKAGYIETPNELFDIIVPYLDHRNRVSYDGETLRILRKSRWDVERFEPRFGKRRVGQLYSRLVRNPEDLHVQLYWRDSIQWSVGEEIIEDGQTGDDGEEGRPEPTSVPRIHELATRLVRRKRLSDEQLLALMRCVSCNAEQLALDEGATCGACGRRYRRIEGFLDFRP